MMFPFIAVNTDEITVKPPLTPPMYSYIYICVYTYVHIYPIKLH